MVMTYREMGQKKKKPLRFEGREIIIILWIGIVLVMLGWLIFK